MTGIDKANITDSLRYGHRLPPSHGIKCKMSQNPFIRRAKNRCRSQVQRIRVQAAVIMVAVINVFTKERFVIINWPS